MFFKGSYVALVTPFTKEGAIDEEKLRMLVNYHVENKTAGISPCGTTGESPTLTHEEHKKIVKIVVEEAKGRIHVMAGAGSNSTAEAIELAKFAKEVGADSVLSICPYYNKPVQRGVYAHFDSIAKSVNIPVMLYNVPGRTGINMSPETVYELSKLDNIKGIKEASGNIEQVCNILNFCGENIDVLSGDDALLLPMMSVGAKGVVSVTANFMAKEVAELIENFNAGKIEEARKMHNKLYRLSQAMFIETNPVPVKAVMSMLGRIENNVRLPLVQLSEGSIETLKKLMKEVEII